MKQHILTTKAKLEMNCIFTSKVKKKKQSWNENTINIKAKLKMNCIFVSKAKKKKQSWNEIK